MSRLKNRSKVSIVFFSGLALVIVLGFKVSFAQMESTNYIISQDSINVGGELSSSTNYKLEDTAGEIATGDISSSNYELRAGYQQFDNYVLELASPGNINMPNLSGISADESDQSATWTVNTNEPNGYELKVRSSSAPSMQGAESNLDDYSPVGANPDFTFSIPTTSAEFGFSPTGADITSRYLDNGSVCNSGSSDASLACWDGFSTSDRTIATRATSASYVDTTLQLRAANGSDNLIIPDNFQATLTVTLLAL